MWFCLDSAMHDASRRLQDCLADMYEPDWFGKEEMDTLAEVRQETDAVKQQLTHLTSSVFVLSD